MKKSHAMGAVLLILSFVFVTIYIGINTVGENVYLGSKEVKEEATGWRLFLDNEEKGTISIPAKLEGKKYACVSIEKQISLSNAGEQYLCFRSSQNRVWVYVEEELVYTYGIDGVYALSKSPGSAWNMVKLSGNKESCHVKIVLESPYHLFSGMIAPVYIGTRTGILTFLLKKCIPNCFFGVVFLLLAVFILGSSFILKNLRIECGLYFSLLIGHIGFWFLLESKLEQFIFESPYLYTQLDCILILTFPFILLLYILSLDEYEGDKGLKALFWVSLIYAAISWVLSLVKVCDFVQVLPVSGLLLVGILASIMRNLYLRWKQKRNIKQFGWRDFGLVFMVATAVHDMIYAFFGYEVYSRGWFPIGVIVFLIIIFTGFEKQFVKMYVSQIEDERFKVMAFTDALTGLKNRASFEEEMDVLRKNQIPDKEVYVVIIDINNLKHINDTLGHKLGDKAIIQVADAIHHSFAKYGSCYRIGGDEFCIIIHKIHGIKVKYILDKLTHDISEEYFAEGFSLSIASGYDKFDSNSEGNIDDTLTRADRKMYDCKQDMKENARKQVDRN